MECAAGAAVALDGRRALGPGGAMLVTPGVRHRAAGRMTILNDVVPPSGPADERFDYVNLQAGCCCEPSYPVVLDWIGW